MKKRHLLNWMLFALFAFTFSACDNEPLEGEFVIDQEGEVTAEDGQFVASIEGSSFLAEATTAVYNPDAGTLIISGVKQDGESIFLAVSEAGITTFDLTVVDGTSNSGTYFPAGALFNPFVTVGAAGGTGILNILELDLDALIVTGTFSMEGVRPQLDAEGNPVLDGEGNIVFDTITITGGSFNSIALTIDTSGGGGGGMDPEAAFFANVDDVEFVDLSFTGEQVMVSGVPMVKLVATATTGATMRIDIPEGMGTGTFNFMDPISDGTKLIAIYTDPDGEKYTSDVGSGSITITEFGETTGKLAATFNFVGTDPINSGNTTEVNITDGEFNIDYIENTGAIENSFSADIEGIGYVPTTIDVSQSPFQGTTLLTVTTTDELTNQSLTISFPITIEAGSYAMSPLFVDGSEKVGLYNPDIGNSIVFTSNPGTLVIESYELNSGIIEASFTFTATDPAGNNSNEFAVTNGAFTVQIQ